MRNKPALLGQIVSLAALALMASPASAQILTNGVYAVHDGHGCWDIPGFSEDAGTPIQSFPCKWVPGWNGWDTITDLNQKFEFFFQYYDWYLDRDIYEIRTVNRPGFSPLCLQPDPDPDHPGSYRIIQGTCSSGGARARYRQWWAITGGWPPCGQGPCGPFTYQFQSLIDLRYYASSDNGTFVPLVLRNDARNRFEMLWAPL